jgi:quinoprotein relay system zinc metallohydrolase 2
MRRARSPRGAIGASSHRSRARAAWLVLLLVAGAARANPQSDALDVDEVAPGVFVHAGKLLPLDAPGHDDIANIGFVVGARCVAVIDSGGSPRIGRALRAAVKSRSALPICYVIDTHVHVDHVLGNVAFKDDKPAFVGHAALADAIERSRAYFLEHYAGDFDAPPSANQIIAPDKLVATTLELDLGGRRLELRAWPKAHTDCDLTVLVPDAGVLWSGDLLFRERVPALDGSAKGWLAAIDELARMKVKIVVPGHGPVARDVAAAWVPERSYLQALIEGVRADIAAGKSIEDATAHVGAAQKSDWKLFDSANARNVSRVYQELEWE